MKRKLPTLRLSISGWEMVEAARQERRWTTRDERWLKEATQILLPEPAMGWAMFWRENPGNFSPSENTLRNRFLRRRYIRRENFIVLCQAVGVAWERVVDLDCPSIIGNPPELMDFYGRSTAIAQLQQWMTDRTRLIVVHGRAGMGKSSLARHVLNSVADQFDVLIWQSLESALPLSEWLDKLMSYFPQIQDQPDKLEALMTYLAEHKCLIVLDQWETILRNGGSSQYQPDHQDYQTFLQRIVGDRHQSCVLLLSREKLQHLGLQRAEFSVKFLKLEGLKYPEDKEFLETERLVGTESRLKEFIERYNNPLFLKVIAAQVRDVAVGKVDDYIKLSVPIPPENISELMDSEFQRLSKEEQDIVYWLAIWRSPISREKLLDSMNSSITEAELNWALHSLISRHTIIKVQSDPDLEYWLEPVTLKYVTHRFVQSTANELSKAIQQADFQIAKLIESHSFVIGNNTQINNEQLRRFAKPILNQLRKHFKIQLQENLAKLKSQFMYEVELNKSGGYSEQNLKLLISQSK